jgi:hypothetical protein
MRGDRIIQTQLLMAQGFNSLADMIAHSTGYSMTPVTFLELPEKPTAGMICCISDSGANGWGQVVTPGGFHTVLIWHNGTAWKVLGA